MTEHDHEKKTVRNTPQGKEQEIKMVIVEQEPTNKLDDYDDEVLPRVFTTADTVINIRTREVIVEKDSKLFRVLSRINKVLLVVGTLLMLTVIGLMLALTIQLMDGLHVLQAIRNQSN